MKKALLIYPSSDFQPIQYPTGLFKIASFCYPQFDVKVLDQRVIGNTKIISEVNRYLSKGDVLCIGFSVMTGTQILDAIKLSTIFKNKIPIVWGGLHPTILPEQTLANDFVDYIVMGEGEDAFLNLLNYLDGNPIKQKLFLSGSNSNFKYNTFESYEYEEYIDFENFPVDEQYIISRDGFKKAFSLETSRGCPFKCGFCHNAIFNKKYRAISAATITKTIDYIVKKHEIDGVVFQEDNFFIKTNRLNKLFNYFCKKNQKCNLGWKANCRVDFMLKNIQEDTFVDSLLKSNCRLIQFGIESGTNKILKLINKKITIEDVVNLNRHLSKIPLNVRYNFMVGFPGETREDINATFLFIEKLKSENPNMEPPFLNIYTPYPGTPLYRHALDEGLNPPKSTIEWAKFSWNDVSSNSYNEIIDSDLEDISRKFYAMTKYPKKS